MRQIASIQSLRAAAALMVVIGHAQTEAAVAAGKHGGTFTPLSLLPWGAGVDLFFVISGFIMVVASERLFATPNGSASFLARRCKRIVPLYWLATTLYVAIQFATRKPVGGTDLLTSYFFWPHDVYGDGVIRPIYALGWTLQYEMFFYVLFAAAIGLPRRWCVGVVSAVLVVGVGLHKLVPMPAGPLSFWTQPIILEFAFGMAVGLAWREGVRLPLAARSVMTLAALAALGFDLMNSRHQLATWTTPNDILRVIAWGVPAALLVGAAALGREADRPQGFGGTVALGDASYALYLVHPFIIGVAMRVWLATGLAGRFGYWPFILSSLTAAIAISLLVHRKLELPIARGLALRRIDGKRVSVAEAP